MLLPGRGARVDLRRALSALAPALGLVALAGMWPALAGQMVRWRERLVLGALGFWLLSICGPLVSRPLWFPVPTAPGGWQASLNGAFNYVLSQAFSPRALAGCAIWAAAALALPILVRGANVALDALAAAGWAFALAAATLRAQALLGPAGPAPRGLIVASALGAVLAVAIRALRSPV